MINNILIAVDGSNHSLKAVKYGASIAAGTKANVLLFHVMKPYTLPEGMKEFAHAEHLEMREIDVLKKAAEFLEARVGEVAQEAGLENFQMESQEGPVARSIVARANKMKADLLIIGSRGMGDIEGLLRGGVSHRVETLAKCPVLIVK